MLVSCLARKYTNFTYMPDNASNSLSWRRLKLVRLTSPHDCGVKVNHAWYVKEQHKTHHPASEVQNSQVINKIFEGKKQNAKKLKSVKHVLDNPDPDPAWAKWHLIRLRIQKNFIILPDRTPKIRIRNNTALKSLTRQRPESKKVFPFRQRRATRRTGWVREIRRKKSL